MAMTYRVIELIGYEPEDPETERQNKVRLSRLDTKDGLRQINRYVDPDTSMEIVPEDHPAPATRVIVNKTDNERIEGTFDGWFGSDATGEISGLQVVVSIAPMDVRYVALDELVSVVEDPYA